MVIRVIRARVQQEKRIEYIQLCENMTIFRMQSQAGDIAHRICDAQGEKIAPILSPFAAGPAGRGRPRKDNRPLFDAALTVIMTGSYWNKVPPGAKIATVWRRYREWEATGAWEQAWQTLLETL